MPANPTPKSPECTPSQEGPPAPVAPPPIAALLVPAAVAGRTCGRSDASWWRDNSAKRIPAPVRLGGGTLWRVMELREWVESGCLDYKAWQAQQCAMWK
jgi:predicted DNA-binding transcriptional regulator AlpA